MNLEEKGYRYYCGDGDCRWIKPLVAEIDYSHHIDCTDMSDEEFADFIERGGHKITAESTNNK